MNGTAATTTVTDPITFEIFKGALISLADEMGLVTLRTAHSPGINQAMDFSTALSDADGRILAQGSGMMIHLGTFPDATRAVLQKYAGRIYPGDIYIFNDSDQVAQHLPDLYVIKPCFLADQLLGFSIASAHNIDMGGSVPGSMEITNSEIFQEGLQIPLVKLYERGCLNEAVMDILMRNVRLPELVAGDLEGQMAALRAGEAGLVQLAERYTPMVFGALSQELLHYTERLTRAAIQEIPDGAYEFEDWMDDDGVSREHEPIRIHVKVVVSGDSILVDWAGTGPQVQSAINCHITNTRSITYGVLQGALQNDIPSNEGFYRPITVTAPEGSIANAKRPAARGLRGLTCYRLIDTLLGALHKAVPDRAPAAGDGGPAIIIVSATDPAHSSFVTNLNAVFAGWGGRPGLDGIDGISMFGANGAYVSVEVLEQDKLMRIERRGYVTDSGGPGQWRGCLALGIEVRFLADQAILKLFSPRRKFLPYGLAGGKPGTPSASILNPGPEQRILPHFATLNVERSDVLRYVHSAGGGFGDPLLRDPYAVLDDTLDDKITADYALQEYGVAIDLDRSFVDEERTKVLRAWHDAGRG
jgi:N-methylhydantoinase B